jgi:phage portal protein BeeE
VEPIPASFVGYVAAGLFDNPVVAGLEFIRTDVFSEARFAWQQLRGGRPGDLFGTADLALLETPWEGGTTGDLLARMLLDSDMAGNAYWVRVNGELVRLRPDWVEIILQKRVIMVGGKASQVGWRRLGYAYWEGGKGCTTDPAVFLPTEVAHFAPKPDPLATFRGMSLWTPAVREIRSDNQATEHKQAFLENAATPNLAVSLKESVLPETFKKFVAAMDDAHKGPENAGKTLYLGGGADVTVIGKDMKEMDYSGVVGRGETRMALVAGIHPVVAGMSEGLAGSSLNAGNYGAAKRQTADRTFRPLWRNVCGSLAVLFPTLPGARLWYDGRDIAFLRDDASDVASIQAAEAATIRQLLDAGFTPDSVTSAVLANDWSALTHSGLYSVQLQPIGAVAGDTPSPSGGQNVGA